MWGVKARIMENPPILVFQNEFQDSKKIFNLI